MAANTTPIFPVTPNVGFGTLGATGVTGTDGTSASNILLFTAGTNGSRIEEITIRYTGATGGATVCRFWINNGSTHTTAANNTLWMEVTVPTLSSLSQAADNGSIVLKPKNLYLKGGYTIYSSSGTTVTNGLQVTVIGGDY